MVLIVVYDLSFLEYNTIARKEKNADTLTVVVVDLLPKTSNLTVDQTISVIMLVYGSRFTAIRKSRKAVSEQDKTPFRPDDGWNHSSHHSFYSGQQLHAKFLWVVYSWHYWRFLHSLLGTESEQKGIS